MRRSLLTLALFVSLGSCERHESSPPPTPAAARPAPEPTTTSEGPPAKSEDLPPFLDRVVTKKVLKYEDVQDIEVVQVERKDVEWTQGTVGPPKLLVEAPHLFLTHSGPVAPGRGFIDIAETASSRSQTKESILFDVEAGELKRFARIAHSIPQWHSTWGKIVGDDGDLESVLIASDGGVVHWTTSGYEPANVDVVMHPARHQMFVVEHNEDFVHGTTKYALWTDFTKPPPKADHELPFVPWASDSMEPDDRDLFKTYRGPWMESPADINFVVLGWKTENECNRGEFFPDGSFHCTTEDDFPVGDGWRFYSTRKRLVAYHPERGELQEFDWGEVCESSYSAHVDCTTPPRVRIACGVPGATFSWSPDRVVRIARTLRPGGFDHPGRFGRIERTDQGDENGEYFSTAWQDQVNLRLLHSEPLGSLTVDKEDRWVLVEPQTEKHRELWLLDIEGASILPLHRAAGCDDFASVHIAADYLAYSCLDGGNRSRWTEVIDAKRKIKWRTPPLHWHDAWVDPDTGSLVGVRHGKSDRAEVWTLR